MNAGTRTTLGVIRPSLPVSSASVRAGSSSPAPPGWSSGVVSVITPSVVGGSRSISVGADSVSAVTVWAGAVVAGVEAASSSSPPQPEIASSRPIAAIGTKFRLDFRANLPIMDSAESHNADAMDTR